MTSADFAALLAEGMALDVEAHWGAGFLAGRYLPGEMSWSWPDMARPYLAQASRLLDMGTGEGSALLSLAPLPAFTVAYEAWWATTPAATATLRPVGVHLVVCLGSVENTAGSQTGPALPFADASFDVVTNRHEAFYPGDVRRLLRPGGAFVTQQVGSDEADSVRALLGLPPQGPVWDLEVACAQLASAGIEVERRHEERVTARFGDIAALVGYVRSTPWNFPESNPVAMRARLEALHGRCLREGSIDAVTHRFWLAARAPRSTIPPGGPATATQRGHGAAGCGPSSHREDDKHRLCTTGPAAPRFSNCTTDFDASGKSLTTGQEERSVELSSQDRGADGILAEN